MPNAVAYSDEKTLPKVYRALAGNGALEFDQVLAAVDRLQAAGILLREEPEARAPRTAAEAAADAKAQAVDPSPSVLSTGTQAALAGLDIATSSSRSAEASG